MILLYPEETFNAFNVFFTNHINLKLPNENQNVIIRLTIFKSES